MATSEPQQNDSASKFFGLAVILGIGWTVYTFVPGGNDFVASFVNGLTAGYVDLRVMSREDLEEQLPSAIGKKYDKEVKAVELVKESSNNYTGYVEFNDDTKLNLKVTVDGRKYMWRASPWSL